MGIPKFFRYISERYPLTSQLIQENRIPEFDNLYLDFNGIIHSCSHPNDEDAHFRLSEEQIFTSIFAYVDHLFGKIKPKKLFFMAVDGVAPRAKMNQQRSRRFRTSKEANDVREKALSRGEKLPEEKAFDSNCITPGTPFMARLSEQLRYFVNKKITEDSNWRDVEVVLSGHEVPGEGEHKIMEYIRLSRAQPDYNPNVRHCLYGLDADLIMLGLLSHDPHFCLLREEVKFGPARKKGNSSLESTNFYLLHLSLMREYLDLEFQDIAPALSFDYSLERVIDDFILLAVFVGNDFLPNLPDLHIHENGLERLFDVYKKVLPGIDGYINESGVINVKRLQVILDEMASWEQEVFEREYSDINWYKGKQTKHIKEEKPKNKQNQSQLVLTQEQRYVFDRVKSFVLQNRRPKAGVESPLLSMENDFPAKDRIFIGNLAKDLHLVLRWDEYDKNDRNIVTFRLPELPGGKAKASKSGGAPSTSEGNTGNGGEGNVVTVGGEDDEGGEWEDVDEEEDDDEFDEAESYAAIDRVLKKYERAQVLDPDEGGGFDARHANSIQEKMDEWKRNYYKGKLEISYDNEDEMAELVYTYVEGLQWVMHYYYSGVASWGWFYNYHYAPRISDLRGVDQMTFSFELGIPFRPFEQLMGVLPVASRDHIPVAFQDLMYDSNSSILDFYPLEFEQDLNGKKQDWEAIVKIPFIDQGRLLKAMMSREHRLTPEEKQRNSFGTSTKFSYDAGEPTTYPSSLPGFFPNIHRCTCKMEPFDLPTLNGLHLVQGLCDGVVLGKEALAGFPSLQTLPHTASLGFHGVNVHGTESKNKSMVVHISNPHDGKKTEEIAKGMVDQRVFFGWPFLHEGLVKAVSDELFRYEMMTVVPGAPPKVVSNPHAPQGVYAWRNKAERSEELYSKKTGVVTGPVQVLLHIRPLKGLKPLESGAFVKDYEGMDREVEHAVQMCLADVVSEDPRFLERAAPPLSEEFPEGSKLFFLGEHAYGVPGQVSGTTDTSLAVILAFYPNEKDEVEQFQKVVRDRKEDQYFPAFKTAQRLQISGRALSKITSSLMVVNSDNQKTNLGLSLKFEAKGMKVIDYSRKENTRFWEFSEKAIQLIQEYKEKFPEVFRILDRGGDAYPDIDEVFSGADAETRLKDVKTWLKQKGVRDFEPVSLFCDQLSKGTIEEIEKLADELRKSRSGTTFKKAIVKGIPRQAVLKPAHAVYRLQSQKFFIGDRVIMVQDSGSVPLSAKGVVVGLNPKSMDVVWDNSFISGTTLGGRCSQYRGCTVEFNSCLNLTYKQYVRSTKPDAPAQPLNLNAPSFRPRNGPMPDVQPPPGQAPVAGFRQSSGQFTPKILSNPNRGRGAGLGHHLNGTPRGAPPNHLNNGRDRHPPSTSDSHPSNVRDSPTSPPRQAWNRGGGHNNPSDGAAHHHHNNNSPRGQSNGHTRGGQSNLAPLPYRGRGGFTNGTPYPHGGPLLHSGYNGQERGRGGPRGRGRGRGRGGDGGILNVVATANANGSP